MVAGEGSESMAAILVVDDDTISLRMLSYTLQKHGHEVITALNGRIAIGRLSERRFDLLIADLTMPEMDGLALLRHVRADPQLRALPVIMLTASGQDQDRLTAEAEGVDAFLTKPTGSHELLEVAGRMLDAAGLRAR